MRFEHLRSKDTEIDAYTFDWHTEAACPPPPTPPCDKDCVCDGVDLSELTESYESNGLSYVDADGNPCQPAAVASEEHVARSPPPPTPDLTVPAVGAVCTNYTTLRDSWRAISDPSGDHDDAGLAEGWYRFEGASGDAIPLYNPAPNGTGGCGTSQPGWLSGCDAWTDTPESWACSTNGTYPEFGGWQNLTVCFSDSTYPCRTAVRVDVTNCMSEYLVWHLRPPPGAGGKKAYCTASWGHAEPDPEPEPAPDPEPEPTAAGYDCVDVMGKNNCDLVHAPDTPRFLTKSQCEANCGPPPALAGNRYCCGRSLGSNECSGSNVSSLLVQFDENVDGSTGSADIVLTPSTGQPKKCNHEEIRLDIASGRIAFPDNATADNCLRYIDDVAGGGRVPYVNYISKSNTMTWAYGEGAPLVLMAGDCTPAPPPPPTVCTKRPDGWFYKIKVCSPLDQSELPADCEDVVSWGAGVAQFGMNFSEYKRTGCQPIGMAITEATRTEHGVLLKWEDAQHGAAGETTTVMGNLICDEDGVGKPGPMDLRDSHGEVTEFSFTFNTEAACHDWPPPPPPPAYTPDLCVASAETDTCTCDGTDVSNLKGTVTLVDADQSVHWIYKLGICGPVARAGLPQACLDNTAANATAIRYETQADSGKEPRCEQLGGSVENSVKATHSEDASGKRDGVDIIYSFTSAECDGGCEVNLRIQCSSADAAVRFLCAL